MMKKPVFLLFIFFSSTVLATQVQARQTVAETDSTTLIFVRHAEKMDEEGNDPALNSEGLKRAESLAVLLSESYDISAIYSTPYKRTQMTAQPLADSLDLEIMEYGFDQPMKLISGIIAENRGKAVLIVGHSNTTPMLVNMTLGQKKYEQLDESDYGNIFIVKTPGTGEGKLTHITY